MIMCVCEHVCVHESNHACISCSALALSCSKPFLSSSAIFFLRASSSTKDKKKAKMKLKRLEIAKTIDGREQVHLVDFTTKNANDNFVSIKCFI